MNADEKIIARLLNALEITFIDNIMMRAMIMTYREHFPKIGDWERDLEILKKEQLAHAKKRFSEFREELSKAHDVERAIQRFLRETPPKGPVQ